jgi:hypothetical protein
MNQLLHKILYINTDFERIFFTNEYQKLAGPRQRTIIMLLLILLLTYFALGFAIGSIENLRNKMDNPYTNWVDLPVKDSQIASKLDTIKKRYNDEKIKEQLQIKNTNGWTRFWLEFHRAGYNPCIQKESDSLQQLAGRTIEETEPLLEKILEVSSKNLVWKDPGFETASDKIAFDACEIIISEKMAEVLGFADLAAIKNVVVRNTDKNDNSSVIFLKVVAVVKELPKDCYFICSAKLYNILTNKIDKAFYCNSFISSNLNQGESSFRYIMPQDSSTEKLQELATTYFGTTSDPQISRGAADELLESGTKSYQIITLSFLPTKVPKIDTLKRFTAFCKSKVPIADFSTVDCGAKGCDILSEGDFHYLAFNFDRLDKIRAFNDDLQKNFDEIHIEMSQVEAKENFALVARLTIAISGILLIFGILTIALFVNNLIKMHLYEVRSNLGTFQAFGLNNQFLVNIYLKIIFSFLLIAVAGALGLMILLDRVEQAVMKEQSSFNIFSMWVLFATIGLFAFSLYRAKATTTEILSDTPGNLIYER